MAWDAVWTAMEAIDPAPEGTWLRYSPQPGPCGSGTLVDVGAGAAVVGAAGSTGAGSAYAFTAVGTATVIAAIAATRPRVWVRGLTSLLLSYPVIA